MQDEYWQQKWRINEVGFNQSQPSPLLQTYFTYLELNPGDHIFVPLCGKSIDMLWLAKQGYKVTGVELSDIACEDFFKENNIPVKLSKMENFTVYESENIVIYCGNYFDITKEMLGKIHAIYDRASLIALPPELQQKYASHLINSLDSSAKILLITMSYKQNEMQGPPFSTNENDVVSLFGSAFTVTQLYSEYFTTISEHLKAKGLTCSTDHVFMLMPIQTA